MSAPDAVDGSPHRHRDVPNCGVVQQTAKVCLWLDPEENPAANYVRSTSNFGHSTANFRYLR